MIEVLIAPTILTFQAQGIALGGKRLNFSSLNCFN